MFQKFLVPFLCSIALVHGGALYGLPGGQSVTTRSQDDYGNYAFSYDIVDEYGAANGRQEKGDAQGNKVGSYVIQDIDGRARRVDYVADAYGFRATIGTNEPGTATSSLGDATVLSTAPVLTAAPVTKVLAAPAPLLAPAPAILSASYAAPAPLLNSYAAPARLLAPAPLALAATKSYGALAAPLGLASPYGLSAPYGLASAPLLSGEPYVSQYSTAYRK